jgi:hypothetical protein
MGLMKIRPTASKNKTAVTEPGGREAELAVGEVSERRTAFAVLTRPSPEN